MHTLFCMMLVVQAHAMLTECKVHALDSSCAASSSSVLQTKLLQDKINSELLWTEVTAGNGHEPWFDLAMSSMGEHQTAIAYSGSIWTSSNYGTTWIKDTTVGHKEDWESVAMSSSGKWQTAVASGGFIWTSSDYGTSWKKVAGTRYPDGASWNAIAMSSDGKRQSAVGPFGKIFTSNDYGATWTKVAEEKDWKAIAMSSSGERQTALAYELGTKGSIWTSSNYGATWTQDKTVGSLQTWRAIAMSSTGQWQTALVSGSEGGIWTSSNYGAAWTQVTSTGSKKNWWSIAMSSTGQRQTAVVNDEDTTEGKIWTSNNYGKTWTIVTSIYYGVEDGDSIIKRGKTWRAIAMSSSGERQTALVYSALGSSGGIWLAAAKATTTMMAAPATTPTTTSAPLQWVAISANAACEIKPDSRRLFQGHYKTLRACQIKCEATSSCIAIDYYAQSTWCHGFNEACTNPTNTAYGASSFKTTRTPSTVESWVAISANAACEIKPESRRLFQGNYKTLWACQIKCEATSSCIAIDYYAQSTWCHGFNEACTNPTNKAYGASSYKTTRTPSTAQAFDCTTMTSLFVWQPSQKFWKVQYGGAPWKGEWNAKAGKYGEYGSATYRSGSTSVYGLTDQDNGNEYLIVVENPSGSTQYHRFAGGRYPERMEFDCTSKTVKIVLASGHVTKSFADIGLRVPAM